MTLETQGWRSYCSLLHVHHGVLYDTHEHHIGFVCDQRYIACSCLACIPGYHGWIIHSQLDLASCRCPLPSFFLSFIVYNRRFIPSLPRLCFLWTQYGIFHYRAHLWSYYACLLSTRDSCTICYRRCLFRDHECIQRLQDIKIQRNLFNSLHNQCHYAPAVVSHEYIYLNLYSRSYGPGGWLMHREGVRVPGAK
jgi:hypothetical protein